MAAINTDDDFVLAVSHLVDAGQLPVTGNRYIDPAARKVYDEQTNPNPPPGVLLIDITPSQAVLEAALDAALAAQAVQAEIDEAIAILEAGRAYLQQQLTSASPHTVTQMVANIRPPLVGNVYLTRAMTNQVGLFVLSDGWNSAAVLTPTTDVNRARFIKAFQFVVLTLRPGQSSAGG